LDDWSVNDENLQSMHRKMLEGRPDMVHLFQVSAQREVGVTTSHGQEWFTTFPLNSFTMFGTVPFVIPSFGDPSFFFCHAVPTRPFDKKWPGCGIPKIIILRMVIVSPLVQEVCNMVLEVRNVSVLRLT